MGRIADVVDGDPCAPVLLLVFEPGPYGAAVVVLLDVECLPQVLGVNDKQEVISGLQVNVPGVVRGGMETDCSWSPRVGNIQDREPAVEQMPDIYVIVPVLQLHGVGATTLVGMPQVHE